VRFFFGILSSLLLKRQIGLDEETTAEQFARRLHESWGVGNVVRECDGDNEEAETGSAGSGILVFLAEHNRALYVSRGSALKLVLTDSRLDRVIQEVMVPLLQDRQYSDALARGIDEMIRYIQLGEEPVNNAWQNLFGYLCFLWVPVSIVFKRLNSRRKQRSYARVKSQLDEWDRARAEALRGTFRAKSCPICLEEFQKDDDEEEEQSAQRSEAPGVSADMNDEGDEDGNRSHSRMQQLLQQQQQHHQQQEQEPLLAAKGSDGLPLKLLRCGHVFDETWCVIC